MKEWVIILKTDKGDIFNFYTWALTEDMARDRAKRMSDCQILSSRLNEET